MRRGIRIGVDVGTVRVGVSRCDPDGILTMPVETLLGPPIYPTSIVWPISFAATRRSR